MSLKKKLQKYKNHVSKAYLVTPVGSMKNSFKKTHWKAATVKIWVWLTGMSRLIKCQNTNCLLFSEHRNVYFSCHRCQRWKAI